MIIDVHCHHVVFSRENGGFIHPSFAKGWRIRWYLNAIGLVRGRDALVGRMPTPREIDKLYPDKLVSRIDQSKLDHAVILAFDGVYDSSGVIDWDRTKKWVSNGAVIELCKRSPKLLFGASINPYRADWERELDKCLDAGAVLIKWLPSVMGFDPSEPRLAPFYKRVVDAGIPLLIHIGFEYALPNIDIRFVGLDRLESALCSGATVIAAHCCGGGVLFDDMRQFAEMRQLVEKYPNLYLDVSALGSAHRKARFLNCLRDGIIRERLVFGTDYPIPTHPWAFRKQLAGYNHTPFSLPENYFDLDILLKRACGLDEKAMSRGYEAITKRFRPNEASVRQ